jgi:outer membrane protein, heavy metal efflux system
MIFPTVTEAEPDLPPAAPPTLDALIQEALAKSPMIASARKHWQALTKVPIQVSTLPDPIIGLRQLTVGSPQPFSGYETSDFYYTGFGVSQDIPGPGRHHGDQKLAWPRQPRHHQPLRSGQSGNKAQSA